MLNHIILIGRLVRDPELRYTSNGIPVSNFTLAVERNYTNQQGERDVDFIRIVTWRKLAENCAHHLGKGRLVAVDGSLQIRRTERDGRTYINPEVVANDVRFLDWPSDKNNSKTSYQANNNDDNDIFEVDEDFDVPF
ncbi:MAG: single-strand DNA-binding protein [Halanaerobiales bacterium]|nr:single-strand DNA-binding protein [Halanaerobiales bacterium]